MQFPNRFRCQRNCLRSSTNCWPATRSRCSQRHANCGIPRRRIRMELPQLQCNALAQVTGADAGGLQRLNQGQDSFHVA